MIEKGKEYRIKAKGPIYNPYFGHKYGTDNPIIRIEGRDTELWPDSDWAREADNGNLAAFYFWQRLLDSGLDIEDGTPAYGGQVTDQNGRRHSELVLEDELEEL